MNKGGFLLYKCRKCGKVSKNIHCPRVSSYLIEIYVFGKSLDGDCKMISIHTCSKKVIGISDLIGCQED